MGELPLILFTICIQAAVGTIIVLLAAQKLEKGQSFKLAALVAAALSIIGILASLIHLGTPSHAFNSIMNLGSSWLSREILFSGGVMVLAVIYAYCVIRKPEAKAAAGTIAWITSIVGLIDVFIMAKVYSTTSIPAWQGASTFIEFFATTIVLGVAVLFMTNIKSLSFKTCSYLGIAVLVSVAVQAAFTIPHYVELSLMGGAGADSAEILTGMSAWVIVQWLLLVLGAGTLLFTKIQSGKISFTRYYITAAALVMGLFVGRYLFYAIHVATKVGLT